jgi:hypothetical protein
LSGGPPQHIIVRAIDLQTVLTTIVARGIRNGHMGIGETAIGIAAAQRMKHRSVAPL